MVSQKLNLGISSCLLGNQVRFDRGHQHDRFLTDTLGLYANFHPVCPEVECGLPIPREAMRLVGDPDQPKLIGRKTGKDYTEQMQKWIPARLDELEKLNLDGFIFKRMSPSNGMERVKVYSEKGGMPQHNGVGSFARAFMQRFPNIPVEEDGRLNDPRIRENFIQRIFIHRSWRRVTDENKTAHGIIDFHTHHKYSLFSHSEPIYRGMGKMIAQAGVLTPNELFSDYEDQLMMCLKKPASHNTHTNVMTHIFGYFKKDLDNDEKSEMLEILENYREGNIPRIVPITLLKHYTRKYTKTYLEDQSYLNPHPLKLKLLNHV